MLFLGWVRLDDSTATRTTSLLLSACADVLLVKGNRTGSRQKQATEMALINVLVEQTAPCRHSKTELN